MKLRAESDRIGCSHGVLTSLIAAAEKRKIIIDQDASGPACTDVLKAVAGKCWVRFSARF